MQTVDQLNQSMPKGHTIPITEYYYTGPRVYLSAQRSCSANGGVNWPELDPNGGAPNVPYDPNLWADYIGFEQTSNLFCPTPVPYTGKLIATPVETWQGEWRVGSPQVLTGPVVQENWWVLYTDRGAYRGIKTPVPAP
jgi:hypothetical protein